MGDATVNIGSIRQKVEKLIDMVHALENTNEKLKQKQSELVQTIENRNKEMLKQK